MFFKTKQLLCQALIGLAAISGVVASAPSVHAQASMVYSSCGATTIYGAGDARAETQDTLGRKCFVGPTAPDGNQVTRGPGNAGLTDKSGAVATGGTSQVVYAGGVAALYVMCQNPVDATETLYVNFGAVASTTAKNSYELSPGGKVEFSGAGFVPTNSVNVTAVTTGHKFICKVD